MSSQELNEELERIRIMISENMFDDAKASLRRILVKNPNEKMAKEKLDWIHAEEEKQLLQGGANFRTAIKPEERSEAIIERLERDFRMKINDNGKKQISAEYSAQIRDVIATLAPKERIDLGVAYLEMELFDVASGIFESVTRFDTHRIEALYLLALTHVKNGKSHEATLLIEPLLRDLALKESDKVDFLYLMATIFEKNNDIGKAREFYRSVFLLNPKYRDVSMKVK